MVYIDHEKFCELFDPADVKIYLFTDSVTTIYKSENPDDIDDSQEFTDKELVLAKFVWSRTNFERYAYAIPMSECIWSVASHNDPDLISTFDVINEIENGDQASIHYKNPDENDERCYELSNSRMESDKFDLIKIVKEQSSRIALLSIYKYSNFENDDEFGVDLDQVVKFINFNDDTWCRASTKLD